MASTRPSLHTASQKTAFHPFSPSYLFFFYFLFFFRPVLPSFLLYLTHPFPSHPNFCSLRMRFSIKLLSQCCSISRWWIKPPARMCRRPQGIQRSPPPSWRRSTTTTLNSRSGHPGLNWEGSNNPCIPQLHPSLSLSSQRDHDRREKRPQVFEEARGAVSLPTRFSPWCFSPSFSIHEGQETGKSKI